MRRSTYISFIASHSFRSDPFIPHAAAAVVIQRLRKHFLKYLFGLRFLRLFLPWKTIYHTLPKKTLPTTWHGLGVGVNSPPVCWPPACWRQFFWAFGLVSGWPGQHPPPKFLSSFFSPFSLFSHVVFCVRRILQKQSICGLSLSRMIASSLVHFAPPTTKWVILISTKHWRFA